MLDICQIEMSDRYVRYMSDRMSDRYVRYMSDRNVRYICWIYVR